MTCLTHVSRCRVTEFQVEGKGRFSQTTMLSLTHPTYASDRKLGKDTRCLAESSDSGRSLVEASMMENHKTQKSRSSQLDPLFQGVILHRLDPHQQFGGLDVVRTQGTRH